MSSATSRGLNTDGATPNGACCVDSAGGRWSHRYSAAALLRRGGIRSPSAEQNSSPHDHSSRVVSSSDQPSFSLVLTRLEPTGARALGTQPVRSPARLAACRLLATRFAA